MKLYLAPMEGVVDFSMREMLTSLGGIDQCVTEFIRVTDRLLPDTVFERHFPELKTRSKTKSGTPVYAQLLGGDPSALSENAARLAELGALGIDLNFGCPAKLVNRHDGGAVLLKSPDRIFKIVSSVRQALPKHTPVTAKIRLGFDDPNTCLETSIAIQSAGAERLTVHCRTKMDMYKPPAYWEWIPKIQDALKTKDQTIPIVVNGDIWNEADLKRCQSITGCNEFMIGRGALRDPFIFARIKNPYTEGTARELILPFFDLSSTNVSPYYAQAKTKQLLKNFSLGNAEFSPLFESTKIHTNPQKFRESLAELVLLSQKQDFEPEIGLPIYKRINKLTHNSVGLDGEDKSDK